MIGDLRNMRKHMRHIMDGYETGAATTINNSAKRFFAFLVVGALRPMTGLVGSVTQGFEVRVEWSWSPSFTCKVRPGSFQLMASTCMDHAQHAKTLFGE